LSRHVGGVLITGFEPFDGAASNPSGDAVTLAAQRWTGPDTLHAAVLPVSFADAGPRLVELVEAHRPEVVIATGLAEGRGAITPERVAINLADARIPDNAGDQPCDSPVVDGGPTAYLTTLPVKHLATALVRAGFPAEVSHSAGTFVCNAASYALLHHLDGDSRPDRPLAAGFVHVPSAEVLPVDDLADALDLLARTALDLARTWAADPASRIPIPGGAVS